MMATAAPVSPENQRCLLLFKPVGHDILLNMMRGRNNTIWEIPGALLAQHIVTCDSFAADIQYECQVVGIDAIRYAAESPARQYEGNRAKVDYAKSVWGERQPAVNGERIIVTG